MKKMPTLLMLLFVNLALLSACAPSASSLAGTSWTLASYGPTFAPNAAAPGVDTNLTFGPDGKLSGSLGCNSMGGEYTLAGQNITFGPLFATEMACDEPRMTQESIAFQILQGTVSFKQTGTTLTITSSDGNNVLIFTAATIK